MDRVTKEKAALRSKRIEIGPQLGFQKVDVQ